MDLFKKGLNGFQLKVLALIFMTFDHIAYMFSGVIQVPFWFQIIGRLSAPLFIFMVAEGMWHTRSRTKYIARLYFASVGMAVLNDLANTFFPMPRGGLIINNIFATMFLITLFIHFGEKMVTAFKTKDFKKGSLALLVLLLPFILTIVVVMTMSTLPHFVLQLVMTCMPTPLLVEGGLLWIILGIGFYLCRGSKKKIGIFYAIFCVITFYLTTGMDLSLMNLFYINVQWLMILTLPFLLLYNGQKGKGMRSFFYIYYPAHLYVLLGLSHLLYAFKN